MKEAPEEWKTNNLCWTGRFRVAAVYMVRSMVQCVSRRTGDGRTRKGPFSIKIPVLER